LLVNTRKPLFIVVILLLINLVVASLMSNHVYADLELYVYEQYNDYLLEIKKETHQVFSHAESDQWQDKANFLANKFDSECNIISREDKTLDDYVKSHLSQPQAASGFVDMDNAIIYYPLNDQFTVEFGPIVFNTWLSFMSEWFSWFIAIFLNVALVFFYLTFLEKKQRELGEAIDKLPLNFDDKKLNPYHHIKELGSHIITLKKDNESRLLLQRDLLHGVAHEFRSPMARIQFALDMLEESSEIEQGKLRQSIHTSLDDLDKLVKELLYYARLKDSESAIKCNAINPVELCISAITQVSPFYNEISFEFNKLTVELQDIYADENLLKRMLVNLLRNAGRFATSLCRVRIIFNENEIVFTVEDDGVGIPPGKTERIFEPFTRLDPSRSRDSGGCGLGLAIVDSIARKHRGKVEVFDGELTGACFKVTLPLSLPMPTDVNINPR
jgi:signal transduction histidine kinase